MAGFYVGALYYQWQLVVFKVREEGVHAWLPLARQAEERRWSGGGACLGNGLAIHPL